jgi:hypothetical protein
MLTTQLAAIITPSWRKEYVWCDGIAVNSGVPQFSVHFVLTDVSEKGYGCETWSLALREKHRLRAFENSVLRRIFGPKRDEVIGGEKTS